MLSPGPQFGSPPAWQRCVTTAFRCGGPPSKNLVDSSVQQNNRFLAVMHNAAVVLLIYQRTRNVWREAVGSRIRPDVCARPNRRGCIPASLSCLLSSLLFLFSVLHQVRHELDSPAPFYPSTSSQTHNESLGIVDESFHFNTWILVSIRFFFCVCDS